LQKTGGSAELSTGGNFRGLGDMDLDLVMVAVGVIGFAATLTWMLAG
jgi:hypothetical protein